MKRHVELWKTIVGLAFLLVADKSIAAQIPLIETSFDYSHQTLTYGSICTRGEVGGDTSYISSRVGDKVAISGQTHSYVFGLVTPSAFSIPCFGAERIMDDAWGWQAEYLLDARPGTVADIKVDLLTQWYRWLLVEGPGDTDAKLYALISLFFRGIDGTLDPVGSIQIDESISRSRLGFSGYLDDWYSEQLYLRGMTTNETLYISGIVGAQSHTDLTNYFPGGLFAESDSYFSLTASAWEAEAPAPVAMPGTIGLLGLGLAGLGLSRRRKAA